MSISLGKKVKELRDTSGFSQGQLAQMLGVGRATLTQIETDNRKLKPEELKKLSEIFDVSIDSLLGGKGNLEIKISPAQKRKFSEILLYVLEKVGAKHNVGKVTLYKLLYFIEFDFFEQYQKKLSGYPFLKLPMGPAPRYFDELVANMITKKEITKVISPYFDYYQQRYIPNRPPDDVLSIGDKHFIDEVLDKYSDHKASEISKLSHQDKPWQMTKDMENISYDLVKFREYPFSTIARKRKKEEAREEIKTSSIFNDLSQESDVYEKYR